MTDYIVSSGQVSSGLVLQSGDQISVTAGGSAIQIVAESGAMITIDGGGTTSGDVLSGGSMTVLEQATAAATEIYSGGTMLVMSADAVTDTRIFSGGIQSAFGNVSGTTVFAGGTLDAFAQTFGTVLSGGLEYLIENQSPFQGAISTNVLAGGVLVDGVSGDYASTSGTVVGSGGVEEVNLNAVASGTVVLDGGVQVIAGATSEIGTDAGTGVAYNTIVSSGGLQMVAGASNGVFNLAGGVADGTVVLSGGTLALGFGASQSNTVLSAGGTIDLQQFGFVSGATANLNSSIDLLTVSAGGATDDVQLAGSYLNEYFHLDSDGAGGTDITVDGTPCYCRGTRVLTTTGEVAVEDLRIGDLLITLSGAARPLRWIGRRAYDARFAAANPDVWPVRFRAGSLGNGLPRRDLFVSPLHAMFLDGLLIPARFLIDGAGITQTASADRVEYLHLELGTHDVIFAEGAAAETYLDDANRGMFHNAAEYAALYRDARPSPAAYCAPRVEDGEALEAVRRRLSGAAPCAPRGLLCGYIDRLERGRIAGWARDAGEGPVRLRVSADGVPLGAFEADMLRADVAAFGGEARCGFDWTIPGGLSPDQVHNVRVQRAADGADLPGSPARLAPASAARTDTASPLRGQIDRADRDEVLGWADDADAPVGLVVLVNGQRAGRVLANRWRADVAAAGIADGRRSFVFRFAGGLAPLDRHEVEVRRESDGAALGAPAIIDPADSFGPALEQTVARAAAALDTDADRMRACLFLREIADRLETPRLPQRARRHA